MRGYRKEYRVSTTSPGDIAREWLVLSRQVGMVVGLHVRASEMDVEISNHGKRGGSGARLTFHVSRWPGLMTMQCSR